MSSLQVQEEQGVFREHLLIESAKEREIAIKTKDWSYRELIDRRGTPRLTASRLGYKRGQLAQLFDLRSDPDERQDLIGSGEQSTGVASTFHAMADSFLAEKVDTVAFSVTSQDHIEALRALGYVE
jgi:hypothetical protein